MRISLAKEEGLKPDKQQNFSVTQNGCFGWLDLAIFWSTSPTSKISKPASCWLRTASPGEGNYLALPCRGTIHLGTPCQENPMGFTLHVPKLLGSLAAGRAWRWPTGLPLAALRAKWQPPSGLRLPYADSLCHRWISGPPLAACGARCDRPVWASNWCSPSNCRWFRLGASTTWGCSWSY